MDIVLTDSPVSRRHARLRIDGGLLLVEDLASGRGTAVNGAVIDEPTSLALGDRPPSAGPSSPWHGRRPAPWRARRPHPRTPPLVRAPAPPDAAGVGMRDADQRW